MLSEDALRRALGSAGLDAPVRWDEVTTSTNATALALAAAGTPEWTLVAAGHQTAGRGRLGRAWIDRPGNALLCSVVLRPAWDVDRLGLVSLAAGVAMAEAASEVSGRGVRCKWPNDLVVGESKVGGILGEVEIVGGRIAHVVIGIGVNLDPPEGVPGAGAIGTVDEVMLLTGFLSRLRSLMEGSPDEVPRRWRDASATLGRGVQATTVDGALVRGTAVDLDETGALLIDTGRRNGGGSPARVAFGEIRHLDVDRGAARRLRGRDRSR